MHWNFSRQIAVTDFPGNLIWRIVASINFGGNLIWRILAKSTRFSSRQNFFL
jgi:hypothetical protein